jgi:hypothetical protein
VLLSCLFVLWVCGEAGGALVLFVCTLSMWRGWWCSCPVCLSFGYVERLVVLLSCYRPKVRTNRTRAPPASPHTQSTNKQDKSTTSLSTYPKYKQTGQEHHQPLHIPKVQTNRTRLVLFVCTLGMWRGWWCSCPGIIVMI